MVWVKEIGWKDAYTQIIRERPKHTVFVDKYPEGYAFNFGQAYINYKFRSTRKRAIKDMQDYINMKMKR